MKEYIDFPIDEHESLLKRISEKQIIYTTRISNEVNKYFFNSVYDSPFGKLKVVYSGLVFNPLFFILSDFFFYFF